MGKGGWVLEVFVVSNHFYVSLFVDKIATPAIFLLQIYLKRNNKETKGEKKGVTISRSRRGLNHPSWTNR